MSPAIASVKPQLLIEAIEKKPIKKEEPKEEIKKDIEAVLSEYQQSSEEKKFEDALMKAQYSSLSKAWDD
jgi:hypothetical protein